MAGIIAHTVGVIAAAASADPIDHEASRAIVDSGIAVKGVGSAQVTLSYRSDGDFQCSPALGSVTPAIRATEWLVSGSASSWYVRVSKTAGTDPSSGTLATWQQLNSTRDWTWYLGSVGTQTATITVDFSTSASGPAEFTYTGITIDLTVS